jgi:hypothetical protein
VLNAKSCAKEGVPGPLKRFRLMKGPRLRLYKKYRKVLCGPARTIFFLFSLSSTEDYFFTGIVAYGLSHLMREFYLLGDHIQ